MRKYPKGATHCVDPDNMADEVFYRQKDDHLEIFIMGRHQWFKSPKPVEYLNTIHKLEGE